MVREHGLGWVNLLRVSVTVDLSAQVGEMEKSYLTTDTFLKPFILKHLQLIDLSVF